MKISILAKSMATLGLIGGASTLLSGSLSMNHAIAGMLIALGIIVALEHVNREGRVSAAGFARAASKFTGLAFVYGLGLAVPYAMGYIPDTVLTAPIIIGGPAAGAWFVPGTGTAILYLMATQSLLEGFAEASKKDEAEDGAATTDAKARPITSAAGIAFKGTALAAIFAATLNLPALGGILGLPAGAMASGGVLHMVAWPLAAIAAYVAIAAGVRAPLLDVDAVLARVDARFGTKVRGSEHAPFAVAMAGLLILAAIASLAGFLTADGPATLVAQRIEITWALSVATMAGLFGSETWSRGDAATPAAA